MSPSSVLTRTEFQQLAHLHLRHAKALLDAGMYGGTACTRTSMSTKSEPCFHQPQAKTALALFSNSSAALFTCPGPSF